ncbi:MAG: hypothetical protein KC478_07070 [Bacteriovoracaceae bacterium]|nr:hypothetical protein [Bacteriovoracaceae bacterium]
MKYLMGSAFITLCIMFVTSCAGTYRGQNRVQTNEVIVPGGVYKDKTWDDRLNFKKVSFFQGANIYYEILIGEVEKGSPFYSWMGNNENQALACDEFYVVMLYRNPTKDINHASVVEQLRGPNREIIEIPSFKRNFQEHFIASEMNFKGHVVKGLCDRSMGKLDELSIFIPGFEQRDIL